MRDPKTPAPDERTAQQIINDFIQWGIDPLKAERHLNEMLIHFLSYRKYDYVGEGFAEDLTDTHFALLQLLQNIGHCCQEEKESLENHRKPYGHK